jgi:hypothetical protein
LERIKEILSRLIRLPPEEKMLCCAKKFEMSSNLLPFCAYSSNALRIIEARFLSTTIDFARTSFIYPIGAKLGYSPRLTFWRNPRFVFSASEST